MTLCKQIRWKSFLTCRWGRLLILSKENLVSQQFWTKETMSGPTCIDIILLVNHWTRSSKLKTGSLHLILWGTQNKERLSFPEMRGLITSLTRLRSVGPLEINKFFKNPHYFIFNILSFSDRDNYSYLFNCFSSYWWPMSWRILYCYHLGYL